MVKAGDVAESEAMRAEKAKSPRQAKAARARPGVEAAGAAVPWLIIDLIVRMAQLANNQPC